jgi:hypothetical protein
MMQVPYYDQQGVLKYRKYADHIIPRRRQPNRLRDGSFQLQPDMVIGELKAPSSENQKKNNRGHLEDQTNIYGYYLAQKQAKVVVL